MKPLSTPKKPPKGAATDAVLEAMAFLLLVSIRCKRPALDHEESGQKAMQELSDLFKIRLGRRVPRADLLPHDEAEPAVKAFCQRCLEILNVKGAA